MRFLAPKWLELRPGKLDSSNRVALFIKAGSRRAVFKIRDSAKLGRFMLWKQKLPNRISRS